MASSIYKLAEQVKSALGDKGNLQELSVAVRQALAVAAKNSWFQGKNEGVSEVNGAFLYPLKNLVPILDSDYDQYYITLPSSYVDIPHEMGINSVSLMESQDVPFVRIPTGMQSLLSGTDSEGMEGNGIYYTESNRIYFPQMESSAPILLRLAVSFESIIDNTDITIPVDVQQIVVNMVVQQYAPQPPKEADVT